MVDKFNTLNVMREEHLKARSEYKAAAADLVAVVGKIELRQSETRGKIEQELIKLEEEEKQIKAAAKDSARGRARALIYGDATEIREKNVSNRLYEIQEERSALEDLKSYNEVTDTEREEYISALSKAETAANASRIASNAWIKETNQFIESLTAERDTFLSIPRPFGTIENIHIRFQGLDQSPSEDMAEEYNTPYGVLKGGRKA